MGQGQQEIRIGFAPMLSNFSKIVLHWPQMWISSHRFMEPPRIILLVEDDEHVRQLAAGFLERKGYQVFQAGDAREAAEIWFGNSQKIDLLLSDVIMPGWSGPEIAQELLQTRPDLKIIFTSGYYQQTVSETAKLVDTAKFLSKPYSIQKLLDTVRTCFDSQ
jgi:two-component system cell cycle sensor histidine kinase/response regulator CckA